MITLRSGDAEPGILEDVRASLDALREAPRLPIISFSLLLGEAVLSRSGPIGGFLSLPVVLFQVGWIGTERIWFLRLFRGVPFQTFEIWPVTRRFFGRFLVFGLLFASASFPVLVVAFIAFPGKTRGEISTPAYGALIGTGLLLDFAGTFVVPALAFTTRRVRDAVRLGLRMIREEWPRSLPYVLVPPLAIQTLFLVVPRSAVRGPIGVVGAVASGIVGLVFKGAIARYYLRHVEVGNDGAAFIPRRQPQDSEFAPEGEPTNPYTGPAVPPPPPI